ncbi:MAG TPA: GGDEF domain-containing protein [Anaerolineales bacterium]|nr:GGDEF domain-containing protein [Anaerolineales bacterium]
MLKIFRRQFLLDLGELEGDYRAFHLKDDVRQNSFYIILATVSVVIMTGSDTLLYKNRSDLLLWMLLYRGSLVLISILVLIAIRSTSKVKSYDRLMMAWLSFVILFLLLFNFTRPSHFLTSAYDVILPLAIYMISPLKIPYSFALAFGFSVGILYIDYFYKTGIDPATLNMVLVAQSIVHILGLTSSAQIQSYRRKSFRAYIQEKDAKEMVAYLANIDPLTKSLTRRQFFNIAETEFQRFKRYRGSLSILVLDADNFKNINDTYGHHAGDLVLQSFSLVVLEQKRAQDTFGRLGGEEFALLLPETNLQQAKVVAERVQTVWAETPCNVDEQIIYSTVSIGVAQANKQDTSFEDVLRRADRIMYKAKEAGRNRVMTE